MDPLRAASCSRWFRWRPQAFWPLAWGSQDVRHWIRSKPSAQSDTASATKELQIKPIVQTSTGLSGKPFAYPQGEPELRLLRVEFPVGGQVPLHTHPAPLIAYVAQGQIRHTRGDQVNRFGPGEAFVESNQGGPHRVDNVGDEPAVVFVAVASAKDLPTTNFVEPQP